MGITSWFRGLFGGPRSGGAGDVPFAVGRWSAAPMRRGTPELLVAYREMPWLNTLVNVTADGISSLCWKVYRPTSRASAQKMRGFRGMEITGRREALKSMVEAGEATEVPGHPMLRLLSDPSDHLTGLQVAKLLQTHLDLVGEAFLIPQFKGKIPVGLWPLPPSAVLTLPDYALPREDQFFHVAFGRVSAHVHVDQMLHIRHPDPSDPMGRGVGKGFTLGDELDTDEYAARFAKNYFYNNATPAAVIGIEGMPSGEHPNVKAFKEKFNREHQGAENAGKIMITGGKVSYANLGVDLSKMDMGAIRKGARDFARMNWRVPPETVGDLTSSNKSTAWAAGDSLARNCIVPRAEFLRSEYQHRVMPYFGREDDVLDFESPIPADREHVLRVMGTFPSSFTHDEARELAGKKPDPKLKGFLGPLPGQVEAGPKTPDAEQGGEADTVEEQGQPSSKKAAASDPPWASAPIA